MFIQAESSIFPEICIHKSHVRYQAKSGRTPKVKVLKKRSMTYFSDFNDHLV